MQIKYSGLLGQTTCPHCWKPCGPEDVLWVATHADLLGDVRLGPDQMRRFPASRFTPSGDALDATGHACTELACPHCHLSIPRPLLEMEPLFLSILGSPGCGKSYFLAAATWELRRLLPGAFGLAFTDADPGANRQLAAYEEALFLNTDRAKPVLLADLIRKTEEQGDLYDMVSYGDQVVRYPRPFLFALRPQGGHPNARSAERLSRILCLYDNAGESFLAGRDSARAPVTQHLAKSAALLYLFDPLQDPRFRDAVERVAGPVPGSSLALRQEVVLAEAAVRVRRQLHLAAAARHKQPLLVVLTKADVWHRPLLGDDVSDPWAMHARENLAALDLERIDVQSARLRQLLRTTCPEVVSTADGFAQSVTYFAASALGAVPRGEPGGMRASIRPADIRPRGVAAPLLYALRLASPYLIATRKVSR